ncbi:MarR family transcriptional regulator [Halorientalis pallida]|uniref:MarR family transcriptional regulator n=1 Tax=Halorientalis pallida TaxID=2479928 RepID=UPI003C6FB751
MTPSPYRLLEFVAGTYDDLERPLTPADAATRFGMTREQADECFDRLVECELLTRVDDGYRPTITARELLELNIDDEFVVVDASLDECDSD